MWRNLVMSNSQRYIAWLGVALITATGLIHVYDAADSFEDATYKGLLFLANGVAAVIAAIGISNGERGWGWYLGLIVAGGAFIGYIISRTIGLPGIPAEPDAWLEPLGVVSLIAEALFVLTAAYVINDRRFPEGALQ